MAVAPTIIRRPVKHARLRVREDGSVQLVVPNSFDQELINNLLRKRATWIVRHQQFFQARKAARRVPEPDEILLFGESFHYKAKPGGQVVVDEVSKQISSGRDLMVSHEKNRWYRNYARAYLTARASELSAIHRLPFKRLFIRAQKTKWGACSTKGNISLNWRLIQTPKHVIDYVILHELMHTKILNHGHEFWVLLKGAYPRSEAAIRWLSTNPPLDLVVA